MSIQKRFLDFVVHRDADETLIQQQAKVGVGVSIEAMSEDLMEQAEKGGVQAPSVPF